MKVENLSFPEAVERLASEAGMEMPVDTPEERERAKRAATHYEVLERAGVYYEKQWRLPVGERGPPNRRQPKKKNPRRNRAIALYWIR